VTPKAVSLPKLDGRRERFEAFEYPYVFAVRRDFNISSEGDWRRQLWRARGGVRWTHCPWH